MLIIILTRLLGLRLCCYYFKEIVSRTLDYRFNDIEDAFLEAVMHVLTGFFVGCISGLLFKSTIYYFFPSSTLAQFLQALPLFSPHEFMPETTMDESVKRLLENSHDSEFLENKPSESSNSRREIIKFFVVGIAVILFIYSF